MLGHKVFGGGTFLGSHQPARTYTIAQEVGINVKVMNKLNLEVEGGGTPPLAFAKQQDA